MVKLKEIDAKTGTGYSSDSDSDDSLPGLGEASSSSPHDPLNFINLENGPKHQNRTEKKARKLMSKLGMRKVQGFNRVTFRKDNDMLIIINKPEVYKNPTAESYVIFGKPEFKDMKDDEEDVEETADVEEFEEPTIDSEQAAAIIDAAFKAGEDVIRENLLRIIARRRAKLERITRKSWQC